MVVVGKHFYIFACCGLVVEILTQLPKVENQMLPFQRQPSQKDRAQRGPRAVESTGSRGVHEHIFRGCAGLSLQDDDLGEGAVRRNPATTRWLPRVLDGNP